jgi:hypothetical protein
VTTYTRWTAWTLAAVLAFGILTLWVRERWAVAAFELAIYAVTLLWLWLDAALGRTLRLGVAWFALAVPPAWGALQLAAGWTVLPWFTVEAIAAWLAALCAALLGAQAANSERLRRNLENALLIFAALIGIVALLQVLSGTGRAFWLFETGFDSDVLGPFVYRNKYAQFVELVLPLALWRAIENRRAAPLWLSLAAILAAGVVAGASRAGGALLVAEVGLVLLAAWRRGAISGRKAAFVAAQTLALVGVLALAGGWDLLWSRLAGLDPLLDYRWPILASTVEIIRSHLFTGTGLGTWPSVYPQFATFDIGVFVNQAHCDWLQWAADGGLVCAAAPLVAIAALARGLVRSVWGVGFLVVAIHATADYPFHQLPAFAAFLWACAFLAAGGTELRNISARHSS